MKKLLLIVTVVLIVSSWGCTYYPRDENGKKHAPWRDDPCLDNDHWMDSIWIKGGEEELKRRRKWELENPPVDMGDKILR